MISFWTNYIPIINRVTLWKDSMATCWRNCQYKECRLWCTVVVGIRLTDRLWQQSSSTFFASLSISELTNTKQWLEAFPIMKQLRTDKQKINCPTKCRLSPPQRLRGEISSLFVQIMKFDGFGQRAKVNRIFGFIIHYLIDIMD